MMTEIFSCPMQRMGVTQLCEYQTDEIQRTDLFVLAACTSLDQKGLLNFGPNNKLGYIKQLSSRCLPT